MSKSIKPSLAFGYCHNGQYRFITLFKADSSTSDDELFKSSNIYWNESVRISLSL